MSIELQSNTGGGGRERDGGQRGGGERGESQRGGVESGARGARGARGAGGVGGVGGDGRVRHISYQVEDDYQNKNKKKNIDSESQNRAKMDVDDFAREIKSVCSRRSCMQLGCNVFVATSVIVTLVLNFSSPTSNVIELCVAIVVTLLNWLGLMLLAKVALDLQKNPKCNQRYMYISTVLGSLWVMACFYVTVMEPALNTCIRLSVVQQSTKRVNCPWSSVISSSAFQTPSSSTGSDEGHSPWECLSADYRLDDEVSCTQPRLTDTPGLICTPYVMSDTYDQQHNVSQPNNETSFDDTLPLHESRTSPVSSNATEESTIEEEEEVQVNNFTNTTSSVIHVGDGTTTTTTATTTKTTTTNVPTIGNNVHMGSSSSSGGGGGGGSFLIRRGDVTWICHTWTILHSKIDTRTWRFVWSDAMNSTSSISRTLTSRNVSRILIFKSPFEPITSDAADFSSQHVLQCGVLKQKFCVFPVSLPPFISQDERGRVGIDVSSASASTTRIVRFIGSILMQSASLAGYVLVVIYRCFRYRCMIGQRKI